MSNFLRSNLVLPALMLAGSGLCPATTFTFNTTITLDPSKLTPNASGVSYLQTFSGNTPITLQGGDVLTGTISFANGALHVQQPSGGQLPFWLDFDFFPSSGFAGTNFGSSQQYLGLTGTLGSSNPTPTSSGILGNSVIGADLSGNNNARDFTFTGVTYTINIASINDASNNPIAVPFSFSRIDAQSSNISVNQTASTPEPSSLAVFGPVWLALARLRSKRISWRTAS